MTREELLQGAKPILFNTQMVRAILERRKAVTRRLIHRDIANQFDCDIDGSVIAYMCPETGDSLEACDIAPYRQGNVLYVRETWQMYNSTDVESGLQRNGYIYFASPDQHDCEAVRATYKHYYGKEMPWRPSIHMPKEAARIFLRVLAVKPERLKDSFFATGSTIFAIEDEGIDIGEHCRQCIDNYGRPCCNDADMECGMLDEARAAFAQLWESTIKPAELPTKGWAANPWIWVYNFERVIPDDEK